MTTVIPMSDGRCPSCMKPFVEATEQEARDARLAEAERLRERQQQGVRQEAYSAGRRNMMIGGGIFIAGTAVTLFSYLNASDVGGTVVVWWGAILFGLLQFLRGATMSS